MKWGVLVAAIVSMPLIASAATTQPPSCVISTPPGAIQQGSTARLIWYTENATKATIAGIGEVPLQSTRDVKPTQTTTYVMTVTNASASRTCAVIVTVAKAQQSLLYYNSPQPYVYSPNQIFWTPINVPPKYVNGNYVITDEWEEIPSYGYSNSNSWYEVDTPYLPGSSYTMTNTYSLPNGGWYQTEEHCVAGLDCITIGSTYSWLENKQAEVVATPLEPTTRYTEPAVADPGNAPGEASMAAYDPMFYGGNAIVFQDQTPVKGLPGVVFDGKEWDPDKDYCGIFPGSNFCSTPKAYEDYVPTPQPSYGPAIPQNASYQASYPTYPSDEDADNAALPMTDEF